jgi:thiamine pyrophosphokinase
MVVAIIVALATIQSTQASIDFWLEKPATLVRGVNHITVYCRNGGGMDGDFNLVVTFTNASFSSQTEMPYSQVDNSTVKLKFVLHKGDSGEKIVYFSVEETAGFSVKATLERTNFLQFLFLKANDIFPTELRYQWNAENSSYNYVNAL